jgi:ubiquinone/menaquinone biosynthesis C-methylase UbiE
MNPESLLVQIDGRDAVKIGGYVLPAEDFNLARFLRDDLGTTWLHAGGITSTMRLIRNLDIQPGMSVLDMGCGVGSAARHLARKFRCQVTGIDFDPEMIRRANEAIQGGDYHNLSFEQMDATRTRFPDNSFDRVVIQSVACFADKTTLFSEAMRVLKPGGFIGINEVTWLKPPTEKLEQVMCATICQTFRGALLARDWVQAMEQVGFVDASYEEHPFNASTPYQILREEGILNTARIMWRVMRNPEINMRLSAMSDFFKKCPEYFSYGLYAARKPDLK